MTGDESDSMLRDVIERIESLRSECRLLRGALEAQDRREQEAGEKCGVSWADRGCDWPDAVADEVLLLKAKLSERK